MANTVNTEAFFWDGARGAYHINLSSDGTALSDLNLIDISADLVSAPDAIKIRTVQLKMYGNFILTLEFDATTDIAFLTAETQTADVSQEFNWDFRDFPNGGWQLTAGNKAAAGFTGDLLATSSTIANLDGFDLVVTFSKD